MTLELTQEALAALENATSHALKTGDESALTVLGYGEISTVVAWPASDGSKRACKRLPLFSSSDRLANYRSCLQEYIAALNNAGITVAPTVLQELLRPQETTKIAYCVQNLLPAEGLLPRYLAHCKEQSAHKLFQRILEHCKSLLRGDVGIDGQISNWVLLDGSTELAYLDITTPMLRTPDGQEKLDADLFLASLPWAVRGLVKRWMLQGILSKYYDFRGVVLDLLGNLLKEKLERWLPGFTEQANSYFSKNPITQQEIQKYYQADAATWALLQRLRRIDRFWQRTIRRRVYPFLLPGKIERHV